MKKISLLLITLLIILGTAAAAGAETPLVDYWHKVTVLSLAAEDLQPSAFKLRNPAKAMEQSLASARKIKRQLKAVKPPKELKENHQLRLEGIDYLIGGLTSLKDILASKNNMWQDTAAIEKLQKATQKLALAQIGLADFCRDDLKGRKAYTYREELCLYWADMTEKEFAMNEDIQKLLQGSLDLLKTKDASKINSMLLSFAVLQKDVEKMSQEMQAYQPSAQVAELHNKKLVVIDLACEVLAGVNELVKSDKMDNIFNLMNKTDDFVEAQKEYNALFKAMLNKK